MRRVFYLLLVSFFLCSYSLFAQTVDDLVLYSQENPSITARGMAMGNATGVLGSDFSGVSSNPATLGIYRRNDIGIGIGLGMDSRETKYLNTPDRTLSLFGSFNNFGLVLSLRQGNPEKLTGWQCINLGVSYNRLNDYSQISSAKGHNPNDSYADMLAGIANKLGLTSDQLNPSSAYTTYNPHVVVAWGAHIIDELVTNPSENLVRIVSPLGLSETVYQKFNAAQRGDMSEWGFSIGTNISHMLYAGATIGVPVLSRTLERTYEEMNDTPTPTTNFAHYTIKHKLKEKGAGINARVGAIFSPVSFLRIGAAIQTPSLLVINYNEQLTASSTYVGSTPYTAESPQYTGRYSILTPLRAKGSIGILAGKFGMLAADYTLDLFPMSRIAYGESNDSFDELIPDLRPMHSANVGFELLVKAFALRGGIGGSSSPYKLNQEEKESHLLEKLKLQPKYFITGGFGILTGIFYFDIAYRYLKESTERYIYDIPDNNGTITYYTASVLGHNHQLLASFGIRF